MRIIQWMCSRTRINRITNEVIREKVKVTPKEVKLRKTRLRWFDEMKRSVNALVRRHEIIHLTKCRIGKEKLK